MVSVDVCVLISQCYVTNYYQPIDLTTIYYLTALDDGNPKCILQAMMKVLTEVCSFWRFHFLAFSSL